MASSWNDREPILEIASAGKRLPRHVIARGRTVLGRHPSCHVVLPDRHVSREQVALEWDGEILQLDELGTKNPVKLNGELCSKAELSEGDSFRFGDTAVTVRSRARIESVCFSDDSVRVVASANDEPPSKVSLDARDTPAIRSTNAQASPGPADWS